MVEIVGGNGGNKIIILCIFGSLENKGVRRFSKFKAKWPYSYFVM